MNEGHSTYAKCCFVCRKIIEEVERCDDQQMIAFCSHCAGSPGKSSDFFPACVHRFLIGNVI